MSETDRPTVVANLKAPPVHKVIIFQFFTGVFAALISFLLLGLEAAYSVLMGSLICTVPNGYFAFKAFQYRGARFTAQIVRSFYAGETGKLVMTAMLFALVFAGVRPLNELAVILGYMATLFSGLIATAFVQFNPTGNNREQNLDYGKRSS